MELIEGKIYSSAELAEWFGVKPKTFSNARGKKLEELSYFANYEDLGGQKGVLIKKVYAPTYEKKGRIAYNILKEEFHNAWHKSGYDTAARVGSQIWNSRPELQKMIKEKTAKSFISRIRVEFYGRVYINEQGSLGTCKYAYVQSNNWDEAILLTEEQLVKIKEIKRDIYVNEQEPMLYEALRNKEITEEQYNEAIAEWQSAENRAMRYSKFINTLYEELQLVPDKVTLILKMEESVF